MVNGHDYPLPEGYREQRYYTGTDRLHDDLLRCKDCKRLIVYAALIKAGGCPTCGNRRVVEITTLSVWEWLRIRLGLLRFPNRDKFLKEFGYNGEPKAAER